MSPLRPPAPHLSALTPYDPKYLSAEVYASANESPYGLDPSLRAALTERLATAEFNRYPDPLATELRAKLARYCGLDEDALLIGNGGDELISDLLLAWGGNGRKLLIAPPSFSSYEIAAALTGTELVSVWRDASKYLNEHALIERLSQDDIDLVMLASPNNPTGECLSLASVERLCAATDALVLIDQAYIEFADPAYDARCLLARTENLAILRTFSKAWGLAGIRLGYLLAAPSVIGELYKVRQPYSVNSFSALLGSLTLDAPEIAAERVGILIAERQRLAALLVEALAAVPDARVYPSEANFILVKLADATRIWRRLYEDYGVLVRDFSQAPGLADCLRVSVGTPEENDLLLEAVSCVIRS